VIYSKFTVNQENEMTHTDIHGMRDKAIRELMTKEALHVGASQRVAREVAHYASVVFDKESMGVALNKATDYLLVRIGANKWLA
jgi:hypothetical protein